MNFPLKDTTRKDLYLLHKATKEKKYGDRIKIILLLDKGYPQHEIADILMIDEDTVTSWKQKFIESPSVEYWKQTHYYIPMSELSQGQYDMIILFIESTIVKDVAQVLQFVKDEFGMSYSRSWAKKLLHRLGYSYKQLSLFPVQANQQAQQEFNKKYQDLMANLPDNEVVIFMDAAHPQHNTAASKAWITVGEERYIPTNSGRNRVNLNGAYNPVDQKVIVQASPMVNAQSTIKLIKTILAYYASKQKIYLITDNARYYRSKLVNEFLAEHNKAELIFLPPYSPNLNLIERLWKYMRKEIISTNYYETFVEFQKEIKKFFQYIHHQKEKLAQFIGTKPHLMKAG
ncbi:MAG: IS630 family transposase [Vallitaleaceae bacterium]|nr:IS630 family transposase [Vallitaleaceae bacterium]